MFDSELFHTMEIIKLVRSQVKNSEEVNNEGQNFPFTICFDMDETMLSACCEFEPNFKSSQRLPADFTVISDCSDHYMIDVTLRPFLLETLTYLKIKGF